MAWTTPRSWVNGEVVTQTLLNTHVRDNLAYLAGRPGVYGWGGGGDYVTTSGSWVDIDPTNLSLNLNVQAGGRMMCIFQGSVYLNNANLAVNIRLAANGVDQSFGKTYGHLGSQVPYRTPFIVFAFVGGVTPGFYTWRPQWKTVGGATAIIHSASALMGFVAFEF